MSEAPADSSRNQDWYCDRRSILAIRRSSSNAPHRNTQPTATNERLLSLHYPRLFRSQYSRFHRRNQTRNSPILLLRPVAQYQGPVIVPIASPTPFCHLYETTAHPVPLYAPIPQIYLHSCPDQECTPHHDNT